LLGLARATADIGSRSHHPPWVYNYLKKIKIHTVQDGQLSETFAPPDEEQGPLCLSLLPETDSKKLIPIIFLHGLAGSRTS